MKQWLDRFILGVPILLLKQYPYAWLVFVVFWPRSSSTAFVCLMIIAVGILSLRWQYAAWISHLRRQYAGHDGKFYIDEPPIPWKNTVRNISMLLAVSLLIAYLMQGQFGWTFWQYFSMAIGFTLFNRDTQFFGSTVTYIITATGIGIRLVPGHLDYRLFLPFKEISRIERGEYRQSPDIDILARTRDARDGLLLIPKDPNGFTSQVDKLFIVPRDIEKFIEQLPYGFGNTSY
jgi:hypothetical protein